MGKRVKWFSQLECEQIRNGQLDYVSFFTLSHLQQGDADLNLSYQDLLQKYRNIDRHRVQRLQDFMSGF